MRWLLLLLVLVFGIASSQTNPPVQSDKKQKQPKAEERGSDKNPLSIKILPAPDADSKAEKDEEHRKAKAREDEQITSATVWLARITGALALFTGGLWWATYRLARDAKGASDRQAAEMIAALAHAEISANAAAKAAETANAQFVSANRPRLIVRMMYFDRWSKCIKFEVANVGGVMGLLIAARASFSFDWLPEKIVFDPSANMAAIEMHAGTYKEIPAHLDEESVGQLYYRITAAAPVIYVAGYIVYMAPGNVMRRTAFCRRYDAAKKRFTMTDDADPDYEHAD